MQMYIYDVSPNATQHGVQQSKESGENSIVESLRLQIGN